ncbi:MAG TPA: carnitine 3-dehydrogenase [Stellaceae bacterium]|nr:carnitine 3-dehydrogenase [Stellaceae bacterium]
MAIIKNVGLVGGGVIGAGWAARFALNGSDVAVFDPDPELGRKLEAVLGNARRAYAKLMPGIAFKEGRVRIAASVEDAVAGADFVQESLPEREDLKRRILAEIDRAAPPRTVIASSTSGLLPSRLQAEMTHPERLVVGHPFNPVYLLPLVEICGGAQTSDETKILAEDIYRQIGMHPLHVRKEVDGFIADRLLEALWREALWLVNDGVATTTEIDDAIRYGAGLRWSFMGTFLIYRMAGGEAGMRHFMSQFGPALKLPWTKLEAPELTDELLEEVSQQSDDQADGISIRALETLRDDCLVSVLAALREQDYGAGAVLKAFQHRLAEPPETVDKPDPTQPLALIERTVPAEWIDYNGHMTEYRYLQVFGDTTDALLGYIGADAAYLAAGHSYYTAETHILHLGETKLGDRLRATTQILASDAKRLRVFHRLYRSHDGKIVATAEQTLLHVDTAIGKVKPAEGKILDAVARLTAAHATLDKPENAGRAIDW